MADARIWKLHAGGSNKYCSFIPHNLRFFASRFDCEPLADYWEIPPAELSGRSKPAADFVIWMARAPAVSERARDLIVELAREDVEFLPFHEIKKQRYFVMNVLRCEDYLDVGKSEFTDFHERFIFKSNLPRVLPPIFKCPGRCCFN
jgi:hypothetical protein